MENGRYHGPADGRAQAGIQCSPRQAGRQSQMIIDGWLILAVRVRHSSQPRPVQRLGNVFILGTPFSASSPFAHIRRYAPGIDVVLGRGG